MCKRKILLLIALVFILTACTNSNNVNEQENKKNQESSTQLLDENAIVRIDDFSFQLINYS